MNASPYATVIRTVTTRQIVREFCGWVARAVLAGVLIGLAFGAVVALLAYAGA